MGGFLEGTLWGLLVGVCVGSVVGFAMGNANGVGYTQTDAIKHGHGMYHPETGKFQWKGVVSDGT